MVLVKANAESEAGVLPSGEMLAKMGAFNEELAKAGVMLAGEGLQSSAKGCRLRYEAGGKRTVTDGPFTESKELIAGFWIIQVRSKEEAIEWMSRAPFGEGEEIEIRQVFEASDFPEDIFPVEAQEAEQALRDKLQGQYSNS
jgi:hypothetical protein